MLQGVKKYGNLIFLAISGHFGPPMIFQIFVEVAKYQEEIQ